MPNRILRPGINDSRAVCSLSDSAEILYRRLMVIVDDYGRFEADPVVLRSHLFARLLDRWPVERVSAALMECATTDYKKGIPLVTLYEDEEKMYLQINNFGQPTRSKSRCPAPTLHASARNCLQMISPFVCECVLSDSYSSSYSCSDAAKSAPEPERKPAATTPPPIPISERKISNAPAPPLEIPNIGNTAKTLGKFPERSSRPPVNAPPTPPELIEALTPRGVDMAGIRKLWADCRRVDPGCTVLEVIGVVQETAPRWQAVGVDNPIGLLLTVVPLEFRNGGMRAVQVIRDRIAMSAKYARDRSQWAAAGD